jgi:hypothetical protein
VCYNPALPTTSGIGWNRTFKKLAIGNTLFLFPFAHLYIPHKKMILDDTYPERGAQHFEWRWRL